MSRSSVGQKALYNIFLVVLTFGPCKLTTYL